MTFYLHHEGLTSGPYTGAQLALMRAQGKVDSADYVWGDGYTDWEPAAEKTSPARPKPPSNPPKKLRNRRALWKKVLPWVGGVLGLAAAAASWLVLGVYGPAILLPIILGAMAFMLHRTLALVLLAIGLLLPAAFVLAQLPTIQRGGLAAQPLSETPEVSLDVALASLSTADAAPVAPVPAEPSAADLKQQRLAELREAQDAYQQNMLGLESFHVIESRFEMEEDELGLARPVILMTVRNDTPNRIDQAHFRGTVKSADRDVAWIDELFTFEIPGGLAPGAEVTWRLLPDMWGGWAIADVPREAILQVQVVQLDGPGNSNLFGRSAFTPEDEAELQALERQFSAPEPATENF